MGVLGGRSVVLGEVVEGSLGKEVRRKPIRPNRSTGSAMKGSWREMVIVGGLTTPQLTIGSATCLSRHPLTLPALYFKSPHVVFKGIL